MIYQMDRYSKITHPDFHSDKILREYLTHDFVDSSYKKQLYTTNHATGGVKEEIHYLDPHKQHFTVKNYDKDGYLKDESNYRFGISWGDHRKFDSNGNQTEHYRCFNGRKMHESSV